MVYGISSFVCLLYNTPPPPPLRWAELDDYQQPEILRTPLEELCLQIKMLNLGGIAEFLKHAMHPPPKVRSPTPLL